MATYQTTYETSPAIGLKGQIANEEKHNQISRTVSTAAGIKFGAPGFRVAGAGNDHMIAATGAMEDFLGLAVLTGAVPPVAEGSTLVDGYPARFTGAFMTDGHMYVEAGGAVAPGDNVFYAAASDQYFNAAAAGRIGPLPRVVFDTTATGAGQIVEVSLDHRVVPAAA